MYGLVLMAAMTAAPEQPAFCFRRHRACHGCYGGYGCYGCGGCCGGYGGCHGGYGGCFGGGCGGCWGGYGGCYGGGYGGCYGGCYGGGYGGGAWYGYESWGSYGACHGCNGYYAGPTGLAPSMPIPPAVPEEKKMEVPPIKKEGQAAALDRAKLVVEVPADAKLYIDDQLMKTTSDRRTFNTPALEPGQLYYYMLRAEVVRDGKTLTETKRVIVRGGQVVSAAFTDLGGPAVATVKAGADK